MTEATNNASDRAQAFAACPDTGCDWSSFYRGWQAARTAPPAAAVVMPPSPYMPGVEPESLTDYERGEAQGRCDMWAEVARLNPAPTPEPASPWISVEDRLPEKSGVYPACSVHPERSPPKDWLDTLCEFDAKAKKGETKWQHGSGFYDGAITHWMPLPSAPANQAEVKP